jgi:hypothetical protein
MKQYLDRLEGLSVSAEAAEPITPEQMADQMAARMLQE